MTEKSMTKRGGAEERILLGAADLFAKLGYNGVSTRDIAIRASVNEVTIYRHYPRKRDLYLAVLDAELQQVKLRGDLLGRIAEAADGPTQAFLSALAAERRCHVVAGVVTPSSDPFSMSAMAVPLYVFYELSIILGRILHK